MNSIFHRVSIRKYQQYAVPDKLLTLLLRAAMAAPSAGNQQPWEFYIVRDRSAIQALSKATPYSLCAAQAPVVIVPCMRVGCLSDAHRLLDLSAATENLLLQADSLGLGACWIGIAPQPEWIENVRKILSLPSTLEAFALIPCGFPAEERVQQDRFEPQRVHYV